MLDPNNGYDVTTHQACAETVERMTTDIVLVNPPKSQAESIYGTGCNNFDINLAQLVMARFHHRRHRSAVSRGLRRAARCSLLKVRTLCPNWGFVLWPNWGLQLRRRRNLRR